VAIENLKVVDGATAGAWIAQRLEGGFGGKVEQLVPNAFEGYVRLFHPATDADGKPATWAQVAAELGGTAHREMQWHRLMGSAQPHDDYSAWPGREPPIGELDEPTLKALCTILEDHTVDAEHCFFGLSTIHAGVSETYPEAGLLRWTHRDFVVLCGPLTAAGEGGYTSSNAGITRLVDGTRKQVPPTPLWFRQPPNLMWPDDHSWFAQSEYDLDSTLIGGSRELTDALLASPELETWEVERGDSLEAWADRIN
jgi:hypothetical protein